MPYLSCIVRNFPIRGTEKNILRLQISVRKSEYRFFVNSLVSTEFDFISNISKIVVEAMLFFSLLTCTHVRT